VDRNALPAPTAKPAPKPDAPRPAVISTASGQAPGDIETRIAAIWSETLGVAQVSGRDNFFDLGGHSLLAVQAHRAIRDRLGAKQLSITDVFRFPVLSQLAARVAEMTATGPGQSPAESPASAPVGDRAAQRADAMARRRAMRARRRA
ncbi:MAG: hypothetical protein KJN93_07910, partial [Alphaproteobacteria bacterium]|nr:hypothetical protein [Alphaproteobacteria bacterium]